MAAGDIGHARHSVVALAIDEQHVAYESRGRARHERSQRRNDAALVPSGQYDHTQHLQGP